MASTNHFLFTIGRRTTYKNFNQSLNRLEYVARFLSNGPSFFLYQNRIKLFVICLAAYFFHVVTFDEAKRIILSERLSIPLKVGTLLYLFRSLLFRSAYLWVYNYVGEISRAKSKWHQRMEQNLKGQ